MSQSPEVRQTPADFARLPRDTATVAATSIGQLAARTGVTLRTLRYYEARGILKTTRSRSGKRLFTPHECDVAMTLVRLRKLGLSLAEVQPIIDDRSPDAEKTRALESLLSRRILDLEQRLLEVRSALEADRRRRIGEPDEIGPSGHGPQT